MAYGAQPGGSPFFTGLDQSGASGVRSSPSMRSPSSAFQHTAAPSGSVSPLSFERSNSHGSIHASGSYEHDRSVNGPGLGPFRSNSSSTNGLASPASTGIQNAVTPSFTGSSASSFVSSPATNNASAAAGLHLAGQTNGGKNHVNMAALGRSSNSSGSRAGSFTSMGGLAASVGASGFGQLNNAVASSDRVRTNSDHSRQSSGGRATGQPSARQSQHSPLPSAAVASFGLPHSQFGRSREMDNVGEAAIHLATNGAPSSLQSGNARSPLGLVAPQPGQQHRKPSAPTSLNLISAASQFSAESSPSGRPPFARQSFSDGPASGDSGQFLDAGVPRLVPPPDSRPSSFAGQNHSPLQSPYTGQQPPQGQLPGQNQSMSQASGAPQPNTGPLSASDPRTQLLVSNLPYRVRWQDLKDLFRKAGTVLRADVSLSPDNRSRGYGSVLMATEEDAIKAADMLDGFTWQGRTLEVRIDRSGALVGVAGSAATFSQPGAAPGFVSPAPHAAATGPASHLGVPQVGSHGMSSPASGLGSGSSPALSPASSLTASQSTITAGRGSSYSSASGNLSSGGDMSGLSDFERGFMQGQMRSAAVLQQQAQVQGASASNSHSPALYPQANVVGNSAAGGHRSPAALKQPGLDVSSLNVQGKNAWSGLAESSLGYTPNPGGSSVPTGVPGAAALAPWPAGPGSMASAGNYGVQAQPFMRGVPPGMPTTSYAGRVLFVGNLPFHCQWQDLKDLFRAAGNIQRADVAIGPEGRSRGFGTVLFATQEDAQNAVRLYHGFEYSGRTLKVHFDRFAAQNGPAIGTPGAPSQYTGAFAAAQPPSHVSHSSRLQSYPSQSHSHSQTGGAMHQGRQSISAAPSTQMGNGINASGQIQSFSALGAGPQGFGQQGGRQPPLAGSLQQHQQPQQPGGMFGQRGSMASAGQGAGFDTRYQQQGLSQAQQPQRQQYQRQIPAHQQPQSGQRQYQQPPLGQQHQAQPQPQQSQAQQQFSQPYGQGQVSEQFASLSQFGQLGQDPPQAFDQAAFGGMQEQNEAARGLLQQHASSRSHHPSHSLSLNGPLGNPAAFLPSDLMSPGLTSPPPPETYVVSEESASHPGRIQLPPQGFSGLSSGQMSPMHGRMTVPMTPGMPGFTFQAIPETPPLYPQFLSPGLGPFSPPLGTPQAAPHAPSANNVAPGGQAAQQAFNLAGAMSGYNHSMFPGAGAGGLSQEQQQQLMQQQPPTPHWSQSYDHRRPSDRQSVSSQRLRDAVDGAGSDVHDGSGYASRADIARTPGAGPRRPPTNAAEDSADGSGPGHLRRASDGTPGAATPPAADGYPFPSVTGPTSSALLARRASTNSPATSPLPGGPGARRDSAYAQEGTQAAALAPHEALAPNSAEELAKTIARLSVKGAALAKDPNAKRSLSMTAERSAAANAMARLREKAGTPTAQASVAAAASDLYGGDTEPGNLGAPFGSNDGGEQGSLSSRLRLGVQGGSHPGRPSPLSASQTAVHSPGSSNGTGTPQGGMGGTSSSSPFGYPSSGNEAYRFQQPSAGPSAYEEQQQQQRESEAFRNARDTLLGVSMPNSIFEAATSGSALDTSSTPSGSLKSTPNEEGGPPVV